MGTSEFQVRDIRKQPFVWYDRAIIEHFGKVVGVYGHAVYSALAMHANSKGQNCYPSYSTIANYYGMSRRQVIREIERLAELKLISIQLQAATNSRGKGRETNIFTLLELPLTGDYQSPVTTSPITSDCESPVLVTTSHPNNMNINNIKGTTVAATQPAAKAKAPELKVVDPWEKPPREKKSPLKAVPKPKPEPADATMQNEAVKVYCDIIRLTPDIALRKEIAARVTDKERWATVLKDWLGHPNWSKWNVMGQLDRYDQWEVTNGAKRTGTNGRSAMGAIGGRATGQSTTGAAISAIRNKPASAEPFRWND